MRLLVGVRNGCIVTRGDLEATRLQQAGGVLGPGTVQRNFKFPVGQGRVLTSDPRWPLDSTFVHLNCGHSFIVSVCHQPCKVVFAGSTDSDVDIFGGHHSAHDCCFLVLIKEDIPGGGKRAQSIEVPTGSHSPFDLPAGP